MITVYTLPNCVQCNQTKRELDKQGLTYNTVDLTTNEEAYNNITQNLGYKSAPVVIVTDENGETIEHWNGFQPEKLRGIND